MKNITVSVDDETYRKARVRAAELDTSVSAMVREYLASLTQREEDFARLQRMEEAVRARLQAFDGGDRLSRDDLYEKRP
jgi:plasmid stability protein